MKKDRKDFIINKIALGVVPLIILLLSLIVYIGVLCFEKDSTLNTTDFVDILKNLCITGFSVGLGSFLFEFVVNVEYTKKRLVEVVTTDAFINELNDKRKRELRSTLIKSIHAKNHPNILLDDNNITTILDKDVSNILDDYYYEELSYVITIKKCASYIEKDIYLSFEAKTLNGEKTLAPLVNLTFDKIDVGTDVKTLEIQSIVINEEEQLLNKPITVDSLNGILKNEKDNVPYGYRYSLKDYINENKKKFSFKDTIKGSLRYCTRVPSNDFCYSVKVPKACKNFELVVSSVDYDMEVYTFGFNSLVDEGHNKVDVSPDKKNRRIKFNDWILPGEGVLVNLKDNL